MQICNKSKIECLYIYSKSSINQYQRVQLNIRLSINGKKPRVLLTQWNNTRENKVYTFESENLWLCLKSFIQASQAAALVDGGNKSYYIDILVLLQQA